MQGGTDRPNCPCRKAETIVSVILAHTTGEDTAESEKLRVARLYPPKDTAEKQRLL